MNLIQRVHSRISSRADILNISRLLLALTVFPIMIFISASVIFHPATDELGNSKFIWPEYQVGFAFYARAYLTILFGSMPKIFGLAALLSAVHVLLVFMYRNSLSNPLKGSEYLNSFIYFIKEFSALALLIASIALIVTFLTQVLNIYFFMY